jgi:nucleoside-diphosphate-sugar epimerase
MDSQKPAVLVTGVSGNLGLRLLPLLAGYRVIGVDLNPPTAPLSLSFERIDLLRCCPFGLRNRSPAHRRA